MVIICGLIYWGIIKMNKIHDIEEELPDFTKHPEEKKKWKQMNIK